MTAQSLLLAAMALGSPIAHWQASPAMADLLMTREAPAESRSMYRSLAAVPTSEIIVRPSAPVVIQDVAWRLGLTVQRRSVIRDGWVLAAPSPAAAQRAATRLQADRRFSVAFVNRRLPFAQLRQFVPNDPFFADNSPAGGPGNGWYGQWYLINSAGRATVDVNVKPQWDIDTTGVGVTVGIVDDGFDVTHPDLTPNFLAALSLDAATGAKGGNAAAATGAKDNHGTFTAGAAIARGGNGIGITGSAPFASWTGLKLPMSTGITDEADVAAIESDSVTNQLIQIKNHSYGSNAPFSNANPARAALLRSLANGTIHVFAGGNDRGKANQDANKDPWTSVANIIVVGAVNSQGRFASYSSFGANLTCVAPGGDGGEALGQIGTDRQGLAVGYSNEAGFAFPDGNGDYAANQAGTSFTAPIVTGILALAKQRIPGLNSRWAKHLLARSSRQIDPTDATMEGGWVTNAAGVRFNQNYGFGLIDADALIRLGLNTTGTTPVTTFDSGVVNDDQPVPDNATLTRVFNVNATTPLEEVLLTLDIAHANRGQLEATLTSPAGTVHRVFIRSNSDRADDINWTFSMNGFWGENPSGAWTLRLSDVVAGVAGRLRSSRLELNMGTMINRGRGR